MVTPVPEVLVCDTSYVGNYERARRHPSKYTHWPREVLERIGAAIVAITPFTKAEVRAGYIEAGWGPARIAAVEHQLASYTQIPLDEQTLDEYAELAVHCRRVGRAIQHNDLWIAAIARSRGLPLVTSDRDQCDLPGLDTIYMPPPP